MGSTKNNFDIVNKNPDFIICYGGDGTVLFSERKFPQVPKLLVKKANSYRKCDRVLDRIKDVLSKIKDGEFRIREEMKLETEFHDRKLIALNEVQVRNKLPIFAVRFSLLVNGKEINNQITKCPPEDQRSNTTAA